MTFKDGGESVNGRGAESPLFYVIDIIFPFEQTFRMRERRKLEKEMRNS